MFRHKENLTYLPFVFAEPESSELRLDEVPVVREFFDVFLKELLGTSARARD